MKTYLSDQSVNLFIPWNFIFKLWTLIIRKPNIEIKQNVLNYLIFKLCINIRYENKRKHLEISDDPGKVNLFRYSENVYVLTEINFQD